MVKTQAKVPDSQTNDDKLEDFMHRNKTIFSLFVF